MRMMRRVISSTSGRMWLETSTVRPSSPSWRMAADGLVAAHRVHAVQRLVHEEDVGVVGQRLGQLQLLAHALAVAAEAPMGGVGQREALEQFVDAARHPGALHAGQAHQHASRNSRPVSQPGMASLSGQKPTRR